MWESSKWCFFMFSVMFCRNRVIFVTCEKLFLQKCFQNRLYCYVVVKFVSNPKTKPPWLNEKWDSYLDVSWWCRDILKRVWASLWYKKVFIIVMKLKFVSPFLHLTTLCVWQDNFHVSETQANSPSNMRVVCRYRKVFNLCWNIK